MKHVLLLRFLVLFNVWWISSTVFVHASEEKSYPPSSEPETSESEFTDRGWEQRTTNDEHPPTFHTNTVVGEFPTTSEGGQSSDEVTSKKPVNDGKSFTVEAIRRSSVTSNEHEHSNLTTERQVNSESVSKTNKGKDTVESSSSQSFGQYEVETTDAVYSIVDKEKSVTTERSRFSVTLYEEEHSHLTTEQSERQVNSESATKIIEFKDTFESLNTPSVGQHGAETTNTAYSTVDKEKTTTTERSLSSVTTPYEEEHSILTTEWQMNRESESKFPNEEKVESSSSPLVGHSGVVATSAADFLDESNVSSTISKQRDDADVTKTRLGTSTEEVVRQTTLTVSEAVTEEVHAKTSHATMPFTSQTSLPHSQSTTSPMHFPFEDLAAPTNITPVNITSTSVTLRWCQAGSISNFSAKVEEVELDSRQLNTGRRCFENISNETMITDLEFCNWTWISCVIPGPSVISPDPLKAGATYNSTIRVCNSDRCEDALHIFQTVPADPANIKVVEIGTQSVKVSWSQKGVVDNFEVWVSDPLASVCWASVDNETLMTMNGFIDLLSTPGQLLTITITALSGQLRSRVQTKHINTKPSKPGSLVVFDCQNNNLCMQWNQSGIFDSYVISVDDFEANASCWNSSNTVNNLTIVNCTVLHVIQFGSSTTLSVAVKSGNQKSDEIKDIYIKVPAIPEDLNVVTANTTTTMVCFSWKQTGCYDSFDIQISLRDLGYEKNLTILRNNVTGIERDGLMWCITELPCPGAAYSLHVATVSHGKRSDFQNLTFHPAVDFLMECHSQTNESFKLSIQPDVKNNSCPNLEDVVRFEYTYRPVGDESCSNPTGVLNGSLNATVIRLNGSYNTSVVGLIAGVTYQVKVWTVINDTKSKEHILNCTTKPNPPSGLQILSTSSTSMMFNWTSPKGCVADFSVNCVGQNKAENDSKTVTEANAKCDNLTPGALYNVTVSSQLRNNTGIPASSAEPFWFVTVPEPPSDVTVEKNSVNSLQVSVQYNCAKCQCTHFLFNISGKGETGSCRDQSHNFTSLESNTCYNISIYTISNHSGKSPKSQTSLEFKSISGWTLPKAVSSLKVTSPTVDSLTLEWIQLDNSVNGINSYYLMLQSSSIFFPNITLNCSSTVFKCNKEMAYKIGNLTASTNYTITIWAVNEGGFSDEKVITEQTQDLHVPVYAVSALLVGIIASAVVILILAVFIILFALRKKTKFAVPSARRPSDGLGFQNPTFTSDFGESMKPKPIPLDEFIEHLDELHNDSDLRFSAEYAMLTEMSPKHPQTASEMEENRTKNRYSNILPFDHSRVKLIPLDDDDQGSDYINASYMPGYVSKREFIAAQGPMKSTVDDFWRMIWEQHINTIVMVTNLQERGREKCAEYWPTDEEPVFYGDLQVQMKSESQLNYYIIRILDVKLGEKQRVVKHLHFISWPDFGCPENTAVLLDFVLGVRAHAPSQPLQGSGPILVHCSAGVGRTGTFILVDHLLQRMREHRTLDIFGLVLEMRNYRCNMLQTEAQYVFAHECIKTAIERQMISSIRSSNAEDEDGECLYQNVSKKGEDGECMYQNVSRKDKIEEEEECLYENCTKENMERPPV